MRVLNQTHCDRVSPIAELIKDGNHRYDFMFNHKGTLMVLSHEEMSKELKQKIADLWYTMQNGYSVYFYVLPKPDEYMK